jgi:hypothetical protein
MRSTCPRLFTSFKAVYMYKSKSNLLNMTLWRDQTKKRNHLICSPKQKDSFKIYSINPLALLYYHWDQGIANINSL